MGVVQSHERREEKLIHATYALILAFQNQCSHKSAPLRDCHSFNAMLANYNFFYHGSARGSTHLVIFFVAFGEGGVCGKFN